MATSNLRFRIIGEDDASGTFAKVAASAALLDKTFSNLGQNTLGLSKLIGGAGLIPVLAGAAAATTELSVSLGAAAGAAGIFGLSLGGFIVNMAKQQKIIAATQKSLDGATKGTQTYRDTLAKLHTQQAAFNRDFGVAATGLAEVKGAWQSFLQATGDVTKGVLAKGFTLVADVLPKLVPVANAAGRAIGGLITELTVWTRSPEFSNLLDWFQKSGPKAITAFGNSIGHLVHGLGSLLANFAGPGDKAAKTLEHLSKAFDRWAGSKGVSKSVDGFLKYVHNNGGKISAVMGDLRDILPKLAESLGKLGAANLTGIGLFLNLVAGMSQKQFDIVVTGLFGIAAGAKAIAIIAGVVTLIQGLTTAITVLGDACIVTRLGLMGVALWEGIVGVTGALAAVGVGALDAALAVLTSPITAVIAGIALLVAGLVYAYKHSETFHNIVDQAFHGVMVIVKDLGAVFKFQFGIMMNVIHALGKVATWLWNNAFQPLFHLIAAGISSLLTIWARMLDALDDVPGFKWLHGLTDSLYAAANKVQDLSDKINKIPTEHKVDIIVNVIHGVVHGTGGHVPAVGAGSAGGGFEKILVNPGIKLIEGLVEGIRRGYVPLGVALGKVTDYIKTQRDKLNGLLSTRNQFASGFQSFTTSLFGADFGTNAVTGVANTPTVGGILAFQKQQRVQAQRLRGQVRKLVHMGLSPALLKQLQAAGPAGLAEIAALAQGASRQQIRQLNAANRATAGALHGAGMAAGNAIYGDQIVQRRNNIDLAERIARELRRDQGHGKGEYVVVTVDGNQIIKAIRKTKRQKGQKSNV